MDDGEYRLRERWSAIQLLTKWTPVKSGPNLISHGSLTFNSSFRFSKSGSLLGLLLSTYLSPVAALVSRRLFSVNR